MQKKKNKLESFLMNHGGTDSEKNTDIGQLSALSLSLPKTDMENVKFFTRMEIPVQIFTPKTRKFSTKSIFRQSA